MRDTSNRPLQQLAALRTQWRRRRNLQGAAKRQGRRWFAVTGSTVALLPAISVALVLALAGAVVIVLHAEHLHEGLGDTAAGIGAASLYQDLLPGAGIHVPVEAGVHLSAKPGGALLVLNGMQGLETVRVDLCTQLPDADSRRLAPLRIGMHFSEVERMLNESGALRNVVLAGEDDTMPAVRVSGEVTAQAALAQATHGQDTRVAAADAARIQGPALPPLQVEWRARDAAPARWISGDSAPMVQGAQGAAALQGQGWLVWGADRALRLTRRATAACPQAGELQVQLYQRRAAGALAAACCNVLAFPAQGGVRGAWQNPPAVAGAVGEDQSLFGALQAAGLLRLQADGLIAVAPRDLALWEASGTAGRAADLSGWRAAGSAPGAAALLRRLYRQADGAYVLRQVDIHNSERRLLAWRVPLEASVEWQPWSGNVALPAVSQMPGVAARLFASLPQGWQPWQRAAFGVAAAPGASSGGAIQLVHRLAPAERGATLRLLVAGRVGEVHGARVVAQHRACSGAACTAQDDASELVLLPISGAAQVALDVTPLDVSAMGVDGDRRYRHIDSRGGRLVWQNLEQGSITLAASAASAAAPSAVASLRQAACCAADASIQAASHVVQVRDRDGALLWVDGASTAMARKAGLDTMLGVAPGHTASIAGMLARSSRPAGPAALTISLPLQTLLQEVLECVAMRRGGWNGKACHGGNPPVAGRQAGIVLLDMHNGDILAAAGAGNAPVNAGNWGEAKDFDAANPARSPLRLPALQHDGGSRRSPGSTFKVITALGLEMAARRDAQLNALLDGLPLPAINAMARQRGYGFETASSIYPMDAGRVHITNYREQSLERRAQDGRLGLRQAMAYSQNTWFAWAAEWSDRSLMGRPEGGAPGVRALAPGALEAVRPVMAAAGRLGFGQALHLDGGLLPADYRWGAYDALQATQAHIDPIRSRHEVRQMAIGLRMQTTPLHMALAAGAIGEGATVAPRLLASLDGRAAQAAQREALDVRLDRIRAGMKDVVAHGTAAAAFTSGFSSANPQRAAALAALRRNVYGKTGTAPTPDGLATVWFTGWLEPNSLPGQPHRLAFAVFASHSEASGGEHAAPVVAALLATLAQAPVAGAGRERQ